MNLSADEKRLFSLIAKEFRSQPDKKEVSLANVAKEIDLTQDEFVTAVSSLQANTLIEANPNFTKAWLSKKGKNNLNVISAV